MKYFFTETVPAFLKAKAKGNVGSCRAELWMTGIVTDEVKKYMAHELKAARNVNAAIFSRTEIRVPAPARSLGQMLNVLATL